MLVAGSPSALSVILPCRQSEDPGSAFTFRTAPDPNGLVISALQDHITVSVGAADLATMPWRVAGSGGACPHMFTYDERGWMATDTSGSISIGTPDQVPAVSQLTIDATEPIGDAFRVDVTTRPHGSSPSTVQWVTGLLALTLALAASVVAVRQPPSHATSLSQSKRRPTPRYRLDRFDALVIVVVAAWAIIGPAFYDDGWVLARHRTYDEVGRFASYFSAGGIDVPFGYWNAWLAHWWTTAVQAPVLLRVLPSTLIVGAWFAIRLTLSAMAPLAARRKLPIAALAAAFLVGVTAWLMTLRPEPLISLLCAFVIYGVVMFLRRSDIKFFAAASVVATFAAATHPVGFVAVAPLLLAIPALVRWMRSRRGGAIAFASLVLSVSALGVVLFFLDSDLGLRLSATANMRTTDHSLGPLDEPSRYFGLAMEYGGTVLRRLSVALGGLTIVMFIGRIWRRSAAITNVAGWALIAGTIILWSTPSKWVWHFGALVPFMAIALAIEIASLNACHRAPIRRAVAAAGVVGAATFAWGGTQMSNPLDLMQFSWADMPFANSPFWIWCLVLATLTIGFLGLGRLGIGSATALAASTFLILTVVLAITATSSVLVRDAAASDGWTLALQNGRSLLGNDTCGVADSMYASTSTGIRHLRDVNPNSESADLEAVRRGFPRGERFDGEWLPGQGNIVTPEGLLDLRVYGSFRPETLPYPTSYTGGSYGPWQQLSPTHEHVYVQISGGRHDDTLLAVQFGRMEADAVAPMDLVDLTAGPHSNEWRSFEIAVPPGADIARVVASDAASGFGGWIGHTELYSFGGPEADLGAYMADPSTVTLSPPHFAMYFPCAHQPSIAHGVIEPPDIIVSGAQPKNVFGPVEQLDGYEPVAVHPLVVYVRSDSGLASRGVSD